MYQQAVGCAGEYALLGNVLAENISYALLLPFLFSTFFDTAPVSSGMTSVLATNSTVGYKTMDASKQVRTATACSTAHSGVCASGRNRMVQAKIVETLFGLVERGCRLNDRT